MPDLIRHFFYCSHLTMLGLWQSQSPTLIASVIEQTSLFCDTRLAMFGHFVSDMLTFGHAGVQAPRRDAHNRMFHVEQFVLPHLMRHLLF